MFQKSSLFRILCTTSLNSEASLQDSKIFCRLEIDWGRSPIETEDRYAIFFAGQDSTSDVIDIHRF